MVTTVAEQLDPQRCALDGDNARSLSGMATATSFSTAMGVPDSLNKNPGVTPLRLITDEEPPVKATVNGAASTIMQVLALTAPSAGAFWTSFRRAGQPPEAYG